MKILLMITALYAMFQSAPNLLSASDELSAHKLQIERMYAASK
ncbi:hypothetical protein SAMN06313486_10195 [Epsilonproteobacteria bacterium SCGC AD-308-P11]|jgi:hypothetical protein|nr:hypothetical protein SAMN06313486_10195 [Epsilonproteobacteria bacterium SCGC AD-308-P11]